MLNSAVLIDLQTNLLYGLHSLQLTNSIASQYPAYRRKIDGSYHRSDLTQFDLFRHRRRRKLFTGLYEPLGSSTHRGPSTRGEDATEEHRRMSGNGDACAFGQLALAEGSAQHFCWGSFPCVGCEASYSVEEEVSKMKTPLLLQCCCSRAVLTCGAVLISIAAPRRYLSPLSLLSSQGKLRRQGLWQQLRTKKMMR